MTAEQIVARIQKTLLEKGITWRAQTVDTFKELHKDPFTGSNLGVNFVVATTNAVFDNVKVMGLSGGGVSGTSWKGAFIGCEFTHLTPAAPFMNAGMARKSPACSGSDR